MKCVKKKLTPSAVEFNSEKISKVEMDDLPGLEKRTKDLIFQLDNKITLMEIYSRKNNLLFYGLKGSKSLLQTSPNTTNIV